MPISYRVVITDKVQRPDGSSAELAESGSRGYEREHSECQVSGSVVVNHGGRWLATLAVPMTGEQSLLVTIERQGPRPAGAPEVDDVMLVIPSGEADAVVELLRGLVMHARQDGVLKA